MPSLQCRRILGGRNLVRVCNIVVAAIFDFMTVEVSTWRFREQIGRSKKTPALRAMDSPEYIPKFKDRANWSRATF